MPTILPGFLPSVSDSVLLIGHGLQRAVPAVSNHGLNADGDRKHTGVADGKRDNADFARADPCSEENKERVQGKINTHTLICR